MAKQDPKIKIVHLLLNPDNNKDIPLEMWASTVQRQKRSIDSFSDKAHHFYAYTQIYSDVNREELPSESCAQPEIINPSKELKNEPPVLSYGHYGAYLAHRRGATQEFSDDLDALIILEGDVVSPLDSSDFHKRVMETYHFGLEHEAGLITFDKVVFNSGGDYWSEVEDHGKWLKIPHFLLGSMYMVFKREKDEIKRKYESSGWHSPDIWLSWNYHNRCPIFATKTPIVGQTHGASMIDYLERN